MDNDLQFDRIERYLKGKMPADEARIFEEEMAADPDLSEQVELQRLELDSLDFMLEEDLRQKFSDWKTDAPPLPDPALSPRRRWWWMALLVALLGVTGIWLFRPAAPPPPPPVTPPAHPAPPVSTPEHPVAGQEDPASKPPPVPAPSGPDRQLMAIALNTHTRTFPASMQSKLRSGGTSNAAPDDALANGIKAYANSDFKKAVAELLTIQEQPDPQRYALAQKWLGHAYLEQKNFEKAADAFRALADKNAGTIAQDEPEWNLLLSLLPNRALHRREFDGLLEKMCDPAKEHRYLNDAVPLRTQLEQLK